MDLATALKHINDKTDAKLSIKTKIVKLLKSHSINDKTQDISSLYNLFLKKEQDFIQISAMPSDWTSKRAYSVGFQAMRIAMMDVEPIKRHLLSTYGDDVFNSLREKLHQQEKKFDSEYKHERNKKKSSNTIDDVSEKNSVQESIEDSEDFLNEFEEPAVLNEKQTKTYLHELEIKTLKKQLQAALKVILDLQDLETDPKVKKLIYSTYETIVSLSMND